MKLNKIQLVKNWRQGWKWFSAWAFALIVFLATVPLPQEFLMLLPERCREYVVAVVAVCGLILRFVNQTKTHEPSA